jgi:6-phosphogluconolactonase (cycloisomerase 2 family)
MWKLSKMLRMAALAVLPGLCALCGCGFFPPLNQTTPCTDCTTAVSYLYVANQSTSAPAIAGVILTTTTTPASGTTPASSTLSAAGTPSSNYVLSYPPTALAIDPANSYLYVGETDLLAGGVYVYAINSDRSLTLQSTISPVTVATYPVAMQVDPTGGNLVVLNYSTSATDAVIASYAIDASTGGLTLTGTYTIPHAGASQQMAISPSAQSSGIQNVIVTLGTGGIEAFTLNSSTGALSDQGNIAPRPATAGQDLGVAIDPTNTYVYVTETLANVVRAFTFTTSNATTPGGLVEVAGTFPTGVYPSSVLVDTTGKYVYATNKTAATISGFSLNSTTGALTPLGTTGFATGTNPVGLAEDATKAYIGAISIGGTPDLRMFSFDATTAGTLDKALDISTAATSPASAALVVATH